MSTIKVKIKLEIEEEIEIEAHDLTNRSIDEYMDMVEDNLHDYVYFSLDWELVD